MLVILDKDRPTRFWQLFIAPFPTSVRHTDAFSGIGQRETTVRRSALRGVADKVADDPGHAVSSADLRLKYSPVTNAALATVSSSNSSGKAQGIAAPATSSSKNCSESDQRLA
jgi:hypothetical protein